MDTLIVGFLLGLLATWFTARVNKSTDIKTQLLLKIDDWVSTASVKCTSVYYKYSKVSKSFENELVEEISGVFTYGSIGIAKALKNDILVAKLEELDEQIRCYVDSFCEYSRSRYEFNETNMGAYVDRIRNNLNAVISISEDIHEVIASELIRITPSWHMKIWNRVRKNH